MGPIAKAAVSGAGGVVLQMAFVALASFAGGKIAEGVGKGQIAGMIHVAGGFVCLTMLLRTIVDAINATGAVFGM